MSSQQSSIQSRVTALKDTVVQHCREHSFCIIFKLVTLVASLIYLHLTLMVPHGFFTGGSDFLAATELATFTIYFSSPTDSFLPQCCRMPAKAYLVAQKLEGDIIINDETDLEWSIGSLGNTTEWKVTFKDIQLPFFAAHQTAQYCHKTKMLTLKCDGMTSYMGFYDHDINYIAKN
jgi:hypothetical protein